jgi:hypothetical protein
MDEDSTTATGEPALERRSWLVEQAGDYAAPISHHIRDGTGAAWTYQSIGAASLLGLSSRGDLAKKSSILLSQCGVTASLLALPVQASWMRMIMQLKM